MNGRQLFTLADWVVERRPSGWYYTRYRDRKDRKLWRGPYRSEASVTLMIARQHRKELERRQEAA
jgi:hypothetical protein